ncbi:hypothetical protein BGX27_008174 [Mortierella sp. AM989]|nr:hypothetical protein BGX27_008174 [Mortierella sp. AM989]
MNNENIPLLNNNHPHDLLAERPGQGSNLFAYANVVCVVAGAGVLGLPYALKMGGWIGIGVLVLTLLMSIYTASLLVKCLYYNGQHRLSSYQEIGRHAFGRTGLIIVWIFYTSTVIGAPIMYLILAGTEIKGLVTGTDISARASIWICAGIVAIPFVLMKTMKEVAVISIIGALATVILVVVAVRGSIIDFNSPIYEDVHHDIIIFPNLPTTVALMTICFGGHPVFLHVEESMRHPKSWNRVMAAALGTCSILYLATAIPCYLTYGDRAVSPILRNLPNDVFTKIATLAIITHVILAAPILLTSFALELERLTGITAHHHGKALERTYRTLLRLAIIGVCGTIACTVPYFGDFLSLLAALANCTITFVLPILCYFKLVGWKHLKRYELIWCATIVVCGIISAVVGSIDAIKALLNDIENDPSY